MSLNIAFDQRRQRRWLACRHGKAVMIVGHGDRPVTVASLLRRGRWRWWWRRRRSRREIRTSTSDRIVALREINRVRDLAFDFLSDGLAAQLLLSASFQLLQVLRVERLPQLIDHLDDNDGSECDRTSIPSSYLGTNEIARIRRE